MTHKPLLLYLPTLSIYQKAAPMQIRDMCQFDISRFHVDWKDVYDLVGACLADESMYSYMCALV